MAFTTIRAKIAAELGKVSGLRTACSNENGRPPDRALDAAELPGCLIFRDEGQYTRRNTGSTGVQRFIYVVRIELLVARMGPGLRPATEALEPFWLSVPYHFEQNIKLDGLVLTSRIGRDSGEVVLQWGGDTYLGTQFFLSVTEDVTISRS